MRTNEDVYVYEYYDKNGHRVLNVDTRECMKKLRTKKGDAHDIYHVLTSDGPVSVNILLSKVFHKFVNEINEIESFSDKRQINQKKKKRSKAN